MRGTTAPPLLTRAAFLLLTLGGCGGSGPSATQPPAGGASNPCASAGVTAAGAPAHPLKLGPLGHDRRDVLDSLWRHRTRPGDGGTALSAQPPDEDVGDISVLRDDGTVVTRPNPFDLRGKGVRFQPNAAGGYDVVAADAAFRASLGNRVTLADDASLRVDMPFAFPFFGRGQTAAFVNSDGNVTFGEGDAASNERGLGRLLTGAPRAAPFFADLDPSAGGAVFVRGASDAVTVTWCSVPLFDLPTRVTVQAALLPDGTVEVKFADNTGTAGGIVALSPGRGTSFTAVDLSAAGASSGGASAVGERFAFDSTLDEVGVAQRFYQTHPDAYDQLVIFGDDHLIEGDGTFAFELSVNNSIEGLGREVFDASREYGSQGQLKSLVVMDRLSKYPESPTGSIPRLGENNTLSILGQESGHQWLAFLRFKDHTGKRSDALLGRDLSHWSFYFDSDASVMEGNDIEDLGGGSFRTVGTVSRYSAFDLYAMGAVDEGGVPPAFYVENPSGTFQDSESAPQTGVSFTGTRRDVTIQDVVAVMGPRRPSSRDSPRVHRQAFIYVLSAGRTTDASAEIAKLDGIRSAWEAFFAQATGGRMRAETRLR